MKRYWATLLTAVVMVLGVFGLYACGGETPPTPTIPPPTATAVPPTATTAPTTAPTATTVTTSGGGGGTVSGTDATSSEMQLIKDALANTKELKSYHFTIDIAPSAFITQPVKAEGDYVAPNKVYVKGTSGNQSFEQIVVNDKVFVKKGGSWVEQDKQDTSGDPTQAFNPETIVSSSNPFGDLEGTFGQIQTYKSGGTEKVNGVNTSRFNFNLDLKEMMGSEDTSGLDLSAVPSLGDGALWIDPAQKNLHKLNMSIDFAAVINLMMQAFAGLAGTPEPGTTPSPVATPLPPMLINITMTMSKHNDPSINIPLTPEMEAAANTGSAAPTPEVTEDTTPEMVETPESTGAETPEAMPTAGTAPSGASGGITGKAGEPIDIAWAKFTVESSKRESSGNLPPKAGNEYVVITVKLENTSKEPVTTSSFLMFELLDSAGKKADMGIGAKFEKFLDTVQQGDLQPGASVTGEIAYEVPKGAKGLVLEFRPEILNSETFVRVPID